MSAFTNYLRKESELILSGIELLKAYYADLKTEKHPSSADLRMAAYATRIAFETSHVTKEELLLYPAIEDTNLLSSAHKDFLKQSISNHEKGRVAFLSLRLAIDEYEKDPSQKTILSWRLGDLIDHITCHLTLEDENLFAIADSELDSTTQTMLLRRAQELDHAHGMEHLRASKKIFNQLRKARGMKIVP